MKRAMVLICAVCLAFSGCGGELSDHSEVERLLVIQAMGFDLADDGVVLSVSSGSDGMGGQSEAPQDTLRMRAEAATLLSAQKLISDRSLSEELFFAHTSYIVIGSGALKDGVSQYLDYIGRNDSFRLDIPVFAVCDGSAEEIIVGTGDEACDSVNILSSVERSLASGGAAHVFSAGEIAAQLNSNGSSLICAVKTERVSAVDPDAKEHELTAVFDGYAVIGGGRLIGKISADDALAVELLSGRAGAAILTEQSGDCTAALRLGKSSCEILPIYNNDALSGIEVSLKLSAELCEAHGKREADGINAAFREDMYSRVSRVLALSQELHCDFLRLGAVLHAKAPLAPYIDAEAFREVLPHLTIYINVETSLDKGYAA